MDKGGNAMEQNRILLKIKLLMEKRHWTMYRLAKESGIPYSSLNSLFQKNNQPTISTLERICNGLNISMGEFFSTQLVQNEHIQTLSSEELVLINLYRSLDKNDQKLLLNYLKGLAKEPI